MLVPWYQHPHKPTCCHAHQPHPHFSIAPRPHIRVVSNTSSTAISVLPPNPPMPNDSMSDYALLMAKTIGTSSVPIVSSDFGPEIVPHFHRQVHDPPSPKNQKRC